MEPPATSIAEAPATRPRHLVWLWLACVVPSLYEVHRYIGWFGAAAYAVGAAVVVGVIWRVPAGRTPRRTAWMALATLAALILAFAVVFPRVNVHAGRAGSDDDEALDIGARAMMAGRPLYAEATYLGNVARQLPGAFLIAAPFVLAGTSAWQNLLWLPLFFAAIARERSRRGEADGRTFALRLAWMVLIASPVVVHDVLTGTDRVSNAIYVALGLWWITRTRWPRVAGAIWGVTLASRPNFLLLVPVAFGWLRTHRGARLATESMLLSCVTMAALTLPFYFRDPGHFGPAGVTERLVDLDVVFPHAALVVAGVAGAAALALASRRASRAELFRDCAIAQAVPVVASMAIGAFGTWYPVSAYATYGTLAQWFVFMWVASTEKSGADGQK